MKMFVQILLDENGQGMVEYGLILGLIAIIAVGAIIALGNGVEGLFGATQTEMAKAPH